MGSILVLPTDSIPPSQPLLLSRLFFSSPVINYQNERGAKWQSGVPARHSKTPHGGS